MTQDGLHGPGPVDGGVLPQTVNTQGSSQGCTGEMRNGAHHPGQEPGPPGPFPRGSDGPMVWLEPEEGQDGAVGSVSCQTGSQEAWGTRRGSHILSRAEGRPGGGK